MTTANPSAMRRILVVALVVHLVVGGGTAFAEGEGFITGRITDTSGVPLAGECVTSDRFPPSGYQTYAITDGAGRYRLGPLEPGTHHILLGAKEWEIQDEEGAEPCGTPTYRPLWFPGVESKADATPVTVQAAQEVTGVDATLPAYGVVTGRVTGPSGEPVEEVCVVTNAGSRAMTDPDGRYRLSPVRSSDLRIGFVECKDDRDLVAQWYGGAIMYAYENPEDAIPISVADEQIVSGVDAQLVLGARLTFEFPDDAQDGTLPSCLHLLYGAVCTSSWFINNVTLRLDETRLAVREDFHSSRGRWVFPSVPPGRYFLRARGTTGHNRYFNEWYDGAEDFAGAKPIDVTSAAAQHFTVRILGHVGCEPAERTNDEDSDGLTDCRERKLGTGLSDPDSDRDGLTDAQEVDTYLTDPRDLDTDNDGFGDGFEVNGGSCSRIQHEGGSDPRNPLSNPITDIHPVPFEPPPFASDDRAMICP